MPLKLIAPGRRTKRSPYWYIRGTVRGIAVDESTGTNDKAAAEAICIKRQADILRRSVYGPGEAITFLEAAVSYLEAGGDTRFLQPIIQHFGSRRLGEIGQAEIQTCAAKLYPGRKPATLNRQVYTPTAAVLHHAADRWPIAWRRVKRLKVPSHHVRWLQPSEADKLIDACGDHLRPLVTFLLYTGARLSEALDLDWNEVDLQRRRVAFLDTKNGTSRGVPLVERAVIALANIKFRAGRVFRRPDGEAYKDRQRLSGGQIKTAWRGACKRAGLARTITPHDCRHTWATWLYAECRDLRQLMELGGWRTMSMVVRYAHVNPDHLRPAIDLLPGAQSGDNPGTKVAGNV